MTWRAISAGPSVLVSGIKILSGEDLNSRRTRIILAISLGVGVGVAMIPYVIGRED
jgi:xanthine/uracil permease